MLHIFIDQAIYSRELLSFSQAIVLLISLSDHNDEWRQQLRKVAWSLSSTYHACNMCIRL